MFRWNWNVILWTRLIWINDQKNKLTILSPHRHPSQLSWERSANWRRSIRHLETTSLFEFKVPKVKKKATFTNGTGWLTNRPVAIVIALFGRHLQVTIVPSQTLAIVYVGCNTTREECSFHIFCLRSLFVDAEPTVSVERFQVGLEELDLVVSARNDQGSAVGYADVVAVLESTLSFLKSPDVLVRHLRPSGRDLSSVAFVWKRCGGKIQVINRSIKLQCNLTVCDSLLAAVLADILVIIVTIAGQQLSVRHHFHASPVTVNVGTPVNEQALCIRHPVEGGSPQQLVWPCRRGGPLCDVDGVQFKVDEREVDVDVCILCEKKNAMTLFLCTGVIGIKPAARTRASNWAWLWNSASSPPP